MADLLTDAKTSVVPIEVSALEVLVLQVLEMMSYTVDSIALHSTELIESHYTDLNLRLGQLCQNENQMNYTLLLEL